MKKVGITIATKEFEKCIYSSGMLLNILIWYQIFEKCNFDVFFLLCNENETITENQIDFKEKIYKTLLVNQDNINNKKSDLFDFDIVFSIGAEYVDYNKTIKQQNENSKIIYIMLGSTYHNDTRVLYDDKFKNNISTLTFQYDEIWISPHYERFKEYYKVRFRIDNIFICPYLWEPLLISNISQYNFESLQIGVVEPNLEQAKNCIIPIAICEKANKHIHNAKIFCSFQLKENDFLKKYITNTQLFKDNKITCEHRFPLSKILEYCNCIVSCVRDCDLNYVFLECFYLGIPLVHNSPMLKDYGYYYPEYNVTKGKEQILFVLQNHNYKKYMENHKKILYKFSIDNPINIHWVKERINNKVDDLCF